MAIGVFCDDHALTAGASRFENTGIERPAVLRYRVRAYNTGGYSVYSNVAQSKK